MWKMLLHLHVKQNPMIMMSTNKESCRKCLRDYVPLIHTSFLFVLTVFSVVVSSFPLIVPLFLNN